MVVGDRVAMAVPIVASPPPDSTHSKLHCTDHHHRHKEEQCNPLCTTTLDAFAAAMLQIYNECTTI